MFNRYYQDELAYLRELGKEFAQAYPALAPMLADRGGDPDVERLLEGFAFLTGRIRQKLDDELPELILAIAQLLFPQLVRSLPSATILELTPLQNALREPRVVPAGTEFDSTPVDGVRCRFRSAIDCELVPWVLQNPKLETVASGPQLKFELVSATGAPIAQFAPERLRIFLSGDDRESLTLLTWLAQHTTAVTLSTPASSEGSASELSLDSACITLPGFEDAPLFPTGESSFPGFRLLQEYYTLPAKFSFAEIKGLSRVAELTPEATSVTVTVRFDRRVPGIQQLRADALKLHCVPIVNVFALTAEPIRVLAEREQFLVRPAGLRPGQGEVYSIEEVRGVASGTFQRFEIPSFFAFSHGGSTGAQNRVYYSTHLRPSVVGDGADLYVSLGTAENSGVVPDLDVLSIDLLATNGRLASGLRAGEIATATASSPPFAKFRNLTAVTTYVAPPLGQELQWRATAHSAMNLRSLTEVDVLRSVLSVYNLNAIADRQAARASELRVAALRDVRVKPAERLYRGIPVRGLQIDVDLDESGFAGDGDLFLFGAILERVFSHYVSLNSFSKTSIFALQTKATYQWPARSGNLTML
ncbi:MAG TPA: type VI secretion system baseplate subunit TssF [Polyangiaceae bacterium]|nr:type VI secretion system baseplate subunit TssF [Polyangiaceae bacterium]